MKQITRTQIGAVLVVIAAMMAVPIIVVDAMNWRGAAVRIGEGLSWSYFVRARWMSMLATVSLLSTAIALLIRIDRRGFASIERRTLRTGMAMVLRGVLMLGAFGASLSIVEAIVLTQSLPWLGGPQGWKGLDEGLRPQAMVGAVIAVCGTTLCCLGGLQSSGDQKIGGAYRAASYQFTLRGVMGMVFLCAVLALGVRLGSAVLFALLYVLSATLMDYLLLCRPCFQANDAVKPAMLHWIMVVAAMTELLLLFGTLRATLFGSDRSFDEIWAIFSGAAYAALVGLTYAATGKLEAGGES